MNQIRSQADGSAAAEQAASQAQPGQPALAVEVPERPALAPTVQIVGEMQGTGFKERQWLVQRNGRFIQITELLFRIAEQANGERTLEEIAAAVTASTDWMVTADNVRHLIRAQLIPLGLIAVADGTSGAPAGMASQEQARSPLAVRMRMKIISPRIIDPIARVLQIFYAPPILILLLIVIALAHGWLYFFHGVAGSIRDVLYAPALLLVLLPIMIVAGIVHEFGHAAALRYGGGQVRGMGVGLYLIYPAFYTDVTDSYRLGRWARVRTDLGGFYFYLLFALGMMTLYAITGHDFLLLVVLLINLDILFQCLPFVRFDGYWALADLTGIPDFFSQIGPFLRSQLRLPGIQGSKLPPLKAWVKAIFIAYIALTIPVLALLFLLMLTRVPFLMVTFWEAFLMQTGSFANAQTQGDAWGMFAAVTQVLILALPLLVILYLLYSMSWRPAKALWNWSKPTPRRRLTGAVVAAGAVALVALLWAPRLSVVNAAVPGGVQSFEVVERTHVREPVAYAQTPPVGGNHAPVWQNCGFYDTPIASENAVHSLEHGAVWITYRPDLPADQVEALRRLAYSQTHVLVSPIPDLQAPVVASAWGNQLPLDSPADPRLEQFVRAFRLGRNAPERGGPCTGGTGMPR